MPTFGSVSIRTGQEDILPSPQRKESLTTFHRNLEKERGDSTGHEERGGGGDAVTPSGGVHNRIGSGRGAEGARQNGNGVRNRVAGFFDGNRVAGGVLGSEGRSAVEATATVTAAASDNKTPSALPPTYSSLPRSRESTPPPQVGEGGRPAAQVRGAPGRGVRRGEDAPGLLKGLSGRRTPTTQARNRGAR